MPPTSRTYSHPPADPALPPEPVSPSSPPYSGNEFAPLVSSSLTRSPEAQGSASSRLPTRPSLQQSYGDADSTSSESIGTSSQHKRMSATFEDLTPETQGLSQGVRAGHNYSRYSAIPSRNSFSAMTSSIDESDSPYTAAAAGILPYNSNKASFYDAPPGTRASIGSLGPMPFVQGEMVKASTTEALLWDEKNLEDDDYIHNPGPGDFQRAGTVLKSGQPGQSKFNWKSLRGISNVLGIVVVLGGLIGLFALWPIITRQFPPPILPLLHRLQSDPSLFFFCIQTCICSILMDFF